MVLEKIFTYTSQNQRSELLQWKQILKSKTAYIIEFVWISMR